LESNNEQFGGHQAFKQKKWLGIFIFFPLGDLVATKSFDVGLQVVTRYTKIHKTHSKQFFLVVLMLS
jgi:hypothetical protein